MSIDERVARLERALLSYISLSTGEARAVAKSEDELNEVAAQLGRDLQGMADQK